MFTRNITLCVTILFIVSLFVRLPLAQAYPNPDSNNYAYKTAVKNRNNAYAQEDIWENRYNEARAFVDDLLGKWSTNEQAIKDDTWNTVDSATATLIAELVRRANRDSSDDTAEKVAEWLPTLFGTYQTAKNSLSAASGTAKRADYLLALNTAVGALDKVHSENQKAFNAYEEKYDIYLKIIAEHSGVSANSAGLARVPNHSPSGDYSSTTALSLATIKATVKAKDAYSTIDNQNMFMFWYHPGDLRSSSQPVSHTIDHFHHFDNTWKRPDLPSDKRCGGDCGQQFQTPVEHLVVCPHALTSSCMQAGNTSLTGLPTDSNLPAGKATPAGCNDAYFLCSSGNRNEHKVRICGKNDSNGNRCNEPYRNCNNPRYPHRWTTTRHSQGGGLIIGPLDGLLNAVPGGSHTASLNVPSGYQYVYWYLAGPSDTGLGTNVETDTGTGSTASASFSWSVPSDASGDYVITAYTYLSDWSVVQSSYTVSVGSGSSTDTTDTTTTDTSSTTDDSSTSSTTDDDSSSSSTTDDSSSTSPYSLSASSTGSPFYLGDTVTLTLSGSESYYSVSWEVQVPGYTTPTYLSNESADDYGSCDSSTSYTFPSAFRGDYVFRVIVYTYGNMTRYEHTYTITVQ